MKLLREFIDHTLNPLDKQTSPQSLQYLLFKVLNDNSDCELPEKFLEQPFLIAKIFQFLNSFTMQNENLNHQQTYQKNMKICYIV